MLPDWWIEDEKGDVVLALILPKKRKGVVRAKTAGFVEGQREADVLHPRAGVGDCSDAATVDGHA